ncbi:Smr/MutS family protein [Asticcacaulis sp. YBE204]|uniref:Smr/MutS family protein n=1 Tax=Asticcacaulis sp. YBE204 TaxID=1282363 RepID=UPI0003C3C5DE|nr:Smr/MutS family protein [Asticcacaulis sp. YBE204]ESQ77816.1 DNA mismatch repair protein MutS [Asticcacaulis sp. YBE204]
MARFGFKDEDLRLWHLVTATVRPHAPRLKPEKAKPPKPEPQIETVTIKGMPEGQNTLSAPRIERPLPLVPFNIGQASKSPSGFRLIETMRDGPDPIEPKRKRRISRERDPIEARLDLHGLTQIQAEQRLKSFVQQAWANDYRAVLVITGKGMAENGILKRNAPEWLADPALSYIVAGISQAHARHGGTGALYVALKRRQV